MCVCMCAGIHAPTRLACVCVCCANTCTHSLRSSVCVLIKIKALVCFSAEFFGGDHLDEQWGGSVL